MFFLTLWGGTECDPYLYWYFLLYCSSAFDQSFHTSLHQKSLALSVHQACAYLTKIAWRVIDHFWVGSRALRREERVVCVSVRAGTHLSSPLVKQNPWNAEECLFWTWSSVLLQTGEFCTLHSQHNTWFTLSHQRKRWRMHTVTQAHTTHTHTCSHFPSSTQQHAAHRLTRVTHPLAIRIFVCKSSVQQTGALVDTSQPEHL